MTNAFEGAMYLAGRWERGQGPDIRVENPATAETIGTISEASTSQIAEALAAARTAFPVWANLPAPVRAQHLKRIGAILSQRAVEIATIMTMEQGKPLNEARGEIEKLAQTFVFYAEEAVRVHGEIIPNDTEDFQSFVFREPIGVVAAISPWNYPAELIGWKLAAALAAGCTVVVKPPELTPFTALAIARAVEEGGVPPGVVSVLTGSGETVGQALVESPLVDKIAFTGSNRVGLAIQKSATTIKRLSLELGGNCPMIVTASADMDAAVKGAARRSFRNMGQICIAVNRIYVARPMYEEFVTRLGAAADALVIDNGLDNPAADLGAMASGAPLEKTKRHLADALGKGARLVAGGSAPQGEKFARGHFFRPTVLADCTHEMQVMTEETFGPLVGVAPFDTLADAVALANDSPFGLAAYAYTKLMDEMRHLSRRLDFGSVAINTVDAGIINAPYGGRKQSGIGYEHGREGMFEYFNLKHVRVRYDLPEGA
ncbi:NAD-dependent succinate-semialdehyde dehydrogenase [Arsenicitalea aurantiaca]|uniref:NAD-dependent succinate-semialdehyde dehydrogenase n=1 Tax=Arsenicitalea aurantiaca TaxID=1783274 RepID=A0A433XEJ9_9HYPH|nr:NAD-dependent succinate-semialdehyde dehydrogenase [Arsenicitalea aurantiaca]RUT32480.1 NAD-dependent succinate-semialdehyde dehydrogenase [Arsenicitalea aurantiaca]